MRPYDNTIGGLAYTAVCRMKRKSTPQVGAKDLSGGLIFRFDRNDVGPKLGDEPNTCLRTAGSGWCYVPRNRNPIPTFPTQVPQPTEPECSSNGRDQVGLKGYPSVQVRPS